MGRRGNLQRLNNVSIRADFPTGDLPAGLGLRDVDLVSFAIAPFPGICNRRFFGKVKQMPCATTAFQIIGASTLDMLEAAGVASSSPASTFNCPLAIWSMECPS